MDVLKARAARFAFIVANIASASALTACGVPLSTTSADGINETKASCQSTAVANQYIIRWVDGTTSVVHAASKEELVSNVLTPNRPRILMAEQDQVIQLDDPKNLHSLASNTLPPDDWGPQMINAPAIWAQGYQGQGMTVAVVDTGTDITHPQLASNVFVNSGEVPNNKVDDDSNGYVDDVNGYDFNTNSGAVTDGNGHGTHVSGIIGANHTGAVQGVAPKAKILPAPFMDSTGSGQVSDAISAMQYAAKMKANVVNASWGGAPCSSQLQQEIVNLNSAGILFVSAAGNDGVNLDQSPEYPAAFAMSGQLTVAALFYNNASNPVTYMMDGYSNYSYNLVNLAAPGTNILSTWPGGGTQVLSGTSMATPFVSGAAAVLWSAKPSATLVEIRNAIVNGITKGDYAVISRGRLDLQKALATLLGQ